MPKRTFLYILLLILFLTGCGQQKTSPEDLARYYESLLTREEEAQEEQERKTVVVMPTRTSERWINDGVNMKAKLEMLGYEVDLQYADDDIELQIAQIEKMIKDEVDCLVIASIDSQQLTDSLQQKKETSLS